MECRMYISAYKGTFVGWATYVDPIFGLYHLAASPVPRASQIDAKLNILMVKRKMSFRNVSQNLWCINIFSQQNDGKITIFLPAFDTLHIFFIRTDKGVANCDVRSVCSFRMFLCTNLGKPLWEKTVKKQTMSALGDPCPPLPPP